MRSLCSIFKNKKTAGFYKVVWEFSVTRLLICFLGAAYCVLGGPGRGHSGVKRYIVGGGGGEKKNS